MDEADFEGSLVLERLAEINKVDEFFDAIDSDNLGKVTSLMRKAGLDAATIQEVVQRIQEGGNH